MKYIRWVIILLAVNSISLAQAQLLEINEGAANSESELLALQTNDQDTRPNILVIYVDDLHHATFGFMGDPIIQTPNVDHLSEQGITFRNAFVNTAICLTSRGNLMTGRYAARTGIYMDGYEGFSDEHIDMIYPKILKDSGYYTGYIGKWHLGEIPEGVFSNDQKFLGQGRFWDEEEWPGEGTHLTDRIGNQAVDMIKQSPDDRPFAITVGFKAPHVQDGFHPVEPYPATPSTAVLYELNEMPAPHLSDSEFFESQPDLIQESLGRVRWEYRLGTPESLNFQRSLRRYYRMVTGVDEQLGKMIQALRESNKLDNTIIVFTSDHGMYLGERGLAGKWFGHEPSMRIPLIVYDPRLSSNQQGSRRDPIALMIDFKPTFLEWAGVAPSDDVQGKSLVPIINGENPRDWRSEFFYEHHSFADRIPRSEGVRTERYKYLNYLDSNPRFEELYDLETDPGEERNLANDPDYSDLLREMRAKWEEWREKVR
jgi:arylsulfatase A-like enzyme